MIRPYQIEDKQKVIDLLRLNIPQYFDYTEESDFIQYLDNFAEHYFVVEETGQLIACGGINYLEDESIARISWDMVHPDFQSKGIGKQLSLYRINEIKKNVKVKVILVRTSQLAFKFYEKMGFTLEKIEKDYWAKGFDLYLMNMSLVPSC